MSPAARRPDFWLARRQINASQAIFHQWRQLEASGCIENFRIAAGEVEGWREGWFFADSDAYKWLEAAVRIQAAWPDPELGALIDAFIALLRRAQMPDGYLFTYNQVHFPGQRWQNLQIEHELYCHGHLIEAGVSHYEAGGRGELLEIARRAADRIVADFKGQSPLHTPGHQEIEIALLRLHQATPGDTAYLEMARQFIERRGRTRLFGLSLLRQFLQVGQRDKLVLRRKEAYLAAHPGYTPFQIPPGNAAPKPPGAALRWYAGAWNGKYLQQHAPLRRQTAPVGHAVRFAYFETAAAMLCRLTGDATILPALKQAWAHMVARRMYVTGGAGALPMLEGFGRDYELDPRYAYAETCAALACLLWNWEMAQLTGQAQYSELFEWQLYNAAAVGMGLDGATYLYNNPLACRGGVERKPWYAVPCCPSNLSRVWAGLDKYIFSYEPGGVRVHQYISSMLSGQSIALPDGAAGHAGLEISSDLPWEGRVKITITQSPVGRWRLSLRRPVWASGVKMRLNGQEVTPPTESATPVAALPPTEVTAPTESATPVAALPLPDVTPPTESATPVAGGYDPRGAAFVDITRTWAPGDVLEVEFEMPVRLLRAHPKVKGHRGKAAIARGPLVYCLESVDQPGLDIFSARLDPASLTPVDDPDLLGGIVNLQGRTPSGETLTLIPYFLWGNRGPSQMTVWINTHE